MKHILRHIFIALLGMYSLTSYAEVKESTNNWYVGNTQPGDWIQYGYRLVTTVSPVA